MAELRARALSDQHSDFIEFADEGFSRDNLDRPGLDRLRDLVARCEIRRVYIQAPDRLGSGPKMVLAYEEFLANGAEVVFVRGSIEDNPEGKFLLQMHAAFADYEKAKIAERTRRGRLFWARAGVIVGYHLPWGFRFVRKSDNHRARLEIDDLVVDTGPPRLSSSR